MPVAIDTFPFADISTKDNSILIRFGKRILIDPSLYYHLSDFSFKMFYEYLAEYVFTVRNCFMSYDIIKILGIV